MDSHRLTPLDATFLELEEAAASAHMHIGGLLMFDGLGPTLEQLRRHLAARLDAFPIYRQRLSAPQGALR